MIEEIIKAYEEYINSRHISFKVLGNKIGIEPIFDPATSSGGIIIPDVAKGRCSQGIVKFIGKDVKDIRVGDYVFFSGYDGDVFEYDGELILILLETQIQSIVETTQYVTIEKIRYSLKELFDIVRPQLKAETIMNNKLESRTR